MGLNWLHDNKDFTENDIGDNYGFVYLITNTITGKKYVGKKFFYSMKTKVLKGKKKRYKTQSDWQTYYGSNTELQNDVILHGKEAFKREIIHLCKSRGETNYMEAYYQFTEGVLLREDNYNGIIQIKLGKNSVKDLKVTK